MFVTNTTTKLNVKDFSAGRPCHSTIVGAKQACSDLPRLCSRCFGQPVEWRQPGPPRPISQDQGGGGAVERHVRAEVRVLGTRELEAGVVGRRRGR